MRFINDRPWSDPENIKGFQIAAHNYYTKISERNNNVNGMKMICRSQQLVNEGVKWIFDGAFVLEWSVPNYVNRCRNKAI